jgi:hypothetical protein
LQHLISNERCGPHTIGRSGYVQVAIVRPDHERTPGSTRSANQKGGDSRGEPKVTWSAIWESVVIAVMTGVFTGIVAWWILATRVRPRLEVSSVIAKSSDSTSTVGYIYRVKIRNPSRRRNVVDLKIDCAIKFIGLEPSRPDNSFVLPLSTAKKQQYPSLAPQGERTYRLVFSPEDVRSYGRLPRERWGLIHQGDVALDALLRSSLDENGHVKPIDKQDAVLITVTAAHELSGFRRARVCRYTCEQIEEGIFAKESVELAPPDSSPAVESGEVHEDHPAAPTPVATR